MKRSIKQMLCNISYSVNLPNLISTAGTNKIIVLMYHGIIKSYSQNPLKNIYGYNISQKEFAGQMAYLSKNCNVIKTSEAISCENLSHKKKNVIITFDDGYKNNYTNAFPILLKYNLPALFSLTSSFVVDKQPLWPDIIEYAVAASQKKYAPIEWEGEYFDFTLGTTADKLEFIKWLTSRCVEIIQEERSQFLGNVLNELDFSFDNNPILDDADYEPLSPQEIKIMSDSTMAEFASHSVHHYALTRVNKNTLSDELKNSKSTIENITNAFCKYFCIPGGFYDNSIIEAILESGFDTIFTSDTREFDPESRPDIIGRYCITRFINRPLFVDMVHGPFSRISHLFK